MKLFKIAVVVLLAGVGVWVYRACGPTHYVNLPPTARGGWVAFGDSLTYGTGAAEGNDYPKLLSQRLGIPIANLGVPGNTTADAITRLNEALQVQPAVVLLCLGGNDGLQSVSPEKAFANLATIIDRFQQSGSFVVLIGVHSASLRDTNAKRFNKLAKEKGTFYIADILDGVLGHPDLMSDYIHPNEAGYKVIAERIERELASVRAQLPR